MATSEGARRMHHHNRKWGLVSGQENMRSQISDHLMADRCYFTLTEKASVNKHPMSSKMKSTPWIPRAIYQIIRSRRHSRRPRRSVYTQYPAGVSLVSVNHNVEQQKKKKRLGNHQSYSFLSRTTYMFDSAESVNVSCICKMQQQKKKKKGTCDSPGPGNSWEQVPPSPGLPVHRQKK